ncbi:hypothetical protein CRP01_18580 [Flavilitoribacter nigricans DSM 23189 = NBRC 102662]|uniref:Alpha/beta hydrolase n=1 Tax=Flavilitoribacter nigricans (strain ATCC 23147 / DSM 23189 / NBRC 102662 / NCIMB 1420 / SS-2) TaxID=1122177 RepID=A0A2D0NB90_FLAN2|nr:hypothetical protein CRP01_18580 [Flavilitoribacter nigricans DSM 23189 = NBRC 102662]
MFSLAGLSLAQAQTVQGPAQPLAGPGGADYVCDSVQMYDFAEKPYGYWLFEPGGDQRPDSAQVVVLIHGYGAYNPMIYGDWIEHLVRRGNIVIFPRFQRNLFFPRPGKFGDHAARAIRDALLELEQPQYVRPVADYLVVAGHSYGGVVSADLGVNFVDYGIPQPRAILLCAPGSGPLKGGRLKTYKAMPKNTKLVIMASEGDRVVGDEFARLVFETAVHTPERNLIYQYRDSIGIGAGHSQCYAVNLEFDNGRRNPTANRALRRASCNALDYYGYWKILDALISCLDSGDYCRYALGNTLEQRMLGYWSDGRPVRALEVITPN